MDSFDGNSGSRGQAARLSERDLNRAEGPDADGDAEARMRQALGLFGQTRAGSGASETPMTRGSGSHMQVGARRHRFVQDGEVPVSVVRGRRDQPVQSAASAPRSSEERDRLLDEHAAERTAREQAERRLTDAHGLIRTLQTRLGHAELERDEAVAEMTSLREQLQAERVAAQEHVAEQRAAEQRLVEARLVEERATEERTREPRREQSKSGTAAAVEPEPVKWWL